MNICWKFELNLNISDFIVIHQICLSLTHLIKFTLGQAVTPSACDDVHCVTSWQFETHRCRHCCTRVYQIRVTQHQMPKNSDDDPGCCDARAWQSVCCFGLERYKISVFLTCLQCSDHAVSASLSAWQADATPHHDMLSHWMTWEKVRVYVCVHACTRQCVFIKL